MKKLYLLLAAGFLGSQASAQLSPAAFVNISATLLNAGTATPKVMAINFLNPFLNDRRIGVFDEQGHFSVDGEMLLTQNMTIQYNGQFINLYVTPGDSVHLTIDAALLDQPGFSWLKITGDHASLSSQLNEWYQLAARLPVNDFDMTIAPEAMIDSIKMQYREHLAVLDSYAVVNKLDPVIKDWAAQDMKYVIANQLSDYLNLSAGTKDEIRQRRLLFEDDFFKAYDAANFQSMMFPYHLGSCLYGMLKEAPSIDSLVRSGNIGEAAQRGIRLISRWPAGLPRDYLLFSYMVRLIGKLPEEADRLSYAGIPFSGKEGLDYFHRFVDRKRNPAFQGTVMNGITSLEDDSVHNLPPTDLLKYLAQRHPGKIIYLDVYATWCGPCLQEMTHSETVYRTLKEEPVVYANICLQSVRERWLKLVKEKNLKGGNYFLDSDATKIFMSDYQVSGFPSYLLMTPQGEVYTNEAPRPSEVNRLYETIRHMQKK